MECELAVSKLYYALKKEYLEIMLLSKRNSRGQGCCTSILFTIGQDLAGLEGAIQWICKSLF